MLIQTKVLFGMKNTSTESNTPQANQHIGRSKKPKTYAFQWFTVNFLCTQSTFHIHTHKELLAMPKDLRFAREGKSDIPNLNHLNSEFQKDFSLHSQKWRSLQEKAHALFLPDYQISWVKLTIPQSEKALFQESKEKRKTNLCLKNKLFIILFLLV